MQHFSLGRLLASAQLLNAAALDTHDADSSRRLAMRLTNAICFVRVRSSTTRKPRSNKIFHEDSDGKIVAIFYAFAQDWDILGGIGERFCHRNRSLPQAME